VRAAAAVAGTWGHSPRRSLRCNSSLALLHVGASVALVGGDSAGSLYAGSGVSESAGTLQLTEDGVFVGKEIADEAVAEALVHCQRVLQPWAKDTGSKSIRQCSNVSLVGRGQLDQAGEVRADCIKSCDVGQTKLSKRRLKDCNSSGFINIRCGSAVDSLDNLVNVRGDKGVCRN
jgi:hypothetical protein